MLGAFLFLGLRWQFRAFHCSHDVNQAETQRKRPRTLLCWAETFKVREEEKRFERDLNIRLSWNPSMTIIKKSDCRQYKS